MKWLLVQILPGVQPNEPRMSRHPLFFSERVHAHGNALRCGGLGRGESEEWELWRTDDVAANRCVAGAPRRFRILTEAEADAFVVECQRKRGQDPDEEFVSDSDRLTAIVAKRLANVTLSKADEDALDPDHPTLGISKRPRTAREAFGMEPRVDRREPR